MVYDPEEAARQGAIHDAKHAMDDAREGHTAERHAA